jgi:hypothetical protein
MPESPEIAALAKQARDGLDKTAAEARDRLCIHCGNRTRAVANRFGITGYTHDAGGMRCPGDAITNAEPVQRPHLILVDVAARRTLLDEALGWEHKRHKTSPYLSCIAETLLVDGRLRLRAKDENPDAPCDCGRDARVRAVLTALAAPYQEAS